MTRIKPECFVEVWRENTISNITFRSKLLQLKHLYVSLSLSRYTNCKTIALFLIKPTTIPLAERLEARKVNNHLNK